MTRTIEPGTRVLHGDGRMYVYAGPNDSGRFESREYSLLGGGLPTIKCDPSRVAPIAPLDPEIKPDPARVSVVNDKAGRPGTWVGPWCLTVDGSHGGWHRTKRDALAEGARMLAIADWHAGVTA